MSQETYKYWSERLTDAGIVHEVLNHYPDFPEHPEAKADNTGSWMDQPGLVGPAPVPSLAGITPPANVSPKAHLLCLSNIRAISLWNSILARIAFTPSPANALSAGPIYRPPPLDHGH